VICREETLAIAHWWRQSGDVVVRPGASVRLSAVGEEHTGRIQLGADERIDRIAHQDASLTAGARLGLVLQRPNVLPTWRAFARIQSRSDSISWPSRLPFGGIRSASSSEETASAADFPTAGLAQWLANGF